MFTGSNYHVISNKSVPIKAGLCLKLRVASTRFTPSTLAGSNGCSATLTFTPTKAPGPKQRRAGLLARFHLNRGVKPLQSLGRITGHRHHMEEDHNQVIKPTRPACTQPSLALNTGLGRRKGLERVGASTKRQKPQPFHWNQLGKGENRARKRRADVCSRGRGGTEAGLISFRLERPSAGSSQAAALPSLSGSR